jgi:two-component system sensor histidine kinase YesM
MLSLNKRFFLKNLSILLICLIVPLILLSLSTFYIMQSNIKDSINKNNGNILIQIQNNLERIIDDTNSLNLTFSSNPEMINMLYQVLNFNKQDSSSNFTSYSSFIKSALVTTVASRPYIYSIYIYSDNNYRNFISSVDGLNFIDTYFDHSWYDSFLQHRNDKIQYWSDSRSIKQFAFEKRATDVITFYNKFFDNDQGLVVLNVSKAYMERKIKELNLFPNQNILVLDERNHIILKSDFEHFLTDADLTKIYSQSDSSIITLINDEKYYITKITSTKNNWKYVSIIPLFSLYSDTIKLGKIMILMLSILIIICILLALIITRRTYNKIYTIIKILRIAESGQSIPQLPPMVKDEYDLIIQNVLKTYIEQNTLKVEIMEKKYQMRIMELVSLQAQINPHFLFNTFKSIFWMSFQLTNSKNEVSQMIENLSNILYYSIGKQTNLVSFAEEIQTTKNYIEIEQMRYKDKFEVIWEYPGHIDQYYSIKLLIQPIVENAILHGLREGKKKGYIKIKFIEAKDSLLLYVTDNGVGMSKADLHRINSKLLLKQDNDGHIGIYNCNRRLSLTFGDSYGVTVRSKLGLGTSVTVRLPNNCETAQIDTRDVKN